MSTHRWLYVLSIGLLIALLSSVVLLSSPGQASAAPLAATSVSGEITGNTTWTLANSPYEVSQNVTVAAGATLTIEPGVVVRFARYRGLSVDGSLQAVGTAQAPIIFTGSTAQSNWWSGLNIRNAGAATLTHVTVAYAGYSDNIGILKSGTGALALQQSTIEHTAGDGLRIVSGYSSFMSANNTFRNNTGNGVRVGINASFDDDTSTFATNGVHVRLDGGTITQAVTWNLNPAYAFYVTSNITIDETGQLTIRPDTVVKFSQYRGMVVEGTLLAEGTASAPIIFTDWRDDTVGGDANRDGGETAPAANWWSNINVRGGSATLAHVTVRYAGYWDNVGVLTSGGGNLTLRQSTVRNTGGDGVRVSNSTGVISLTNTMLSNNTNGLRLINAGQVGGQGNTFSNNSNYGILQDVNDSFPYTGNSFTGNDAAAVGINGGSLSDDLRLSPAGNPFRILANVTIDADATLTLEAGTRLEFVQYRGLVVDGSLQAVGTATMPITFTGSTAQRNWWSGLNIRNAGAATLTHVTVAYAGYWDNIGILKSGTGALALQQSTIEHTAGDGLRIESGYSSFTSANNTFRHNTGNGVRVGINASFDDDTSTFATNGVHVRLDAGTITEAVTWKLNPAYSFYVTGNIVVGETGQLTILPDTVVKFAQYRSIAVDGILRAEGTASAPIIFTDWRDDTVGGDANRDAGETAPAANWWSNINVRGGSATLAHVTVRYAGYWDNVGILASGSGNLTLQQSTVRNTGGDGVRVSNSTGVISLTNTMLSNNTNGLRLINAGQVGGQGNTFSNNSDYGILQDVNDSFPYTGNSFARNGAAAVGINGGSVSDDLRLSPAGNPFRVLANVTIDADATLTLEAGTRLEFVQYRSLNVDGRLQAVGTATMPITFTGSAPQANWWHGINVRNAGTATLTHANVTYAGYWGNAGILKSGRGNLSLQHSTISHTGGDGVRLSGSTGQHTINNNHFTANATGVFAQNQTQALVLKDNQFVGNRTFGVRNQGSADVDARSNWWGAATGPRHSSNPQGEGDPVSDGVRFTPWFEDAIIEDENGGDEAEPDESFLQRVMPNEAANDRATVVTIYGNGFSTTTPAVVRLLGSTGTVALTEVTPQSTTRFTATLPAGVEAGSYDLMVIAADTTAILPNAFSVFTPATEPQVTAVLPSAGLNDLPVEVVIQGSHFAADVEVYLGETMLASSRLGSRSLLAVVPAELDPGSYALEVKNPDGTSGRLANAYRVLDAEDALNDDLFSSSSDNLWLNPVAPRVGTPASLGLLVERMGGKTVLEDVEVVFRRDALDGPVLGQALVGLLDPRSMDSTMPIDVTFDTAGEVTIFAIIDPENKIAEHNEQNNVVQRTILVAPAGADRIPPVVQRILINGGMQALVTSALINIGIEASDPEPGSGVSHVNIIEYIYSDGIKRWVPIERSGWLPYLDDGEDYRWTLRPLAGMRYIQVRARDEAGNISIGSARRLLNYEIATDRIARNQTRIYRYTLEAGQAFEVNLEVLEGDADLYVWSSRADQSAWVSNLSGSADERVAIAANEVVPGLYQVEVYGYSAATYRLTTSVAANPAMLADLASGGLAEEKDVPTEPTLPLSSMPDENMGSVPNFIPELEQSGHTVYLPLVRR